MEVGDKGPNTRSQKALLGGTNTQLADLILSRYFVQFLKEKAFVFRLASKYLAVSSSPCRGGGGQLFCTQTVSRKAPCWPPFLLFAILTLCYTCHL